MEPVIRILLLLLGALLSVWGGWSEWLFALLLTVVGFILSSQAKWRPAMVMMLRLRWLALSILFIYFWFTPGVPVFVEWLHWSPSYDGIMMGLHRVAVLLLLVVAVSLMLQSTPTGQIVAALLWLLKPFSRLGLPYERLAVRLALTMDAVAELQNMTPSSAPVSSGVLQKVRSAAVQMVDLFDHVTQHADSLPCQPIEVPILTTPNWQQWLMLLVLSGVFLVL